jgi:hypothetical protein
LIHFMEQNHKVETVIRKKGFKLLKILNSNWRFDDHVII